MGWTCRRRWGSGSRRAARAHGPRAVRWVGPWAVLSAVMSAVLLMSAGGCRGPRGPLVLTSHDPAIKIPAMKQALARHDLSASGQLVKDLDSDDPAVRFYAINTLQRLAGQTFGYVYWEDDARRKPALEKWKSWLARDTPAPAASTAPASPPPAMSATEEVRGQ